MQPGDKLSNVRDLATQLPVGRSSIREAITALRTQGIVEVRHGDGIYLLKRPEDVITSLATELVETHVDHPYIWETRQALETQCARLAATRTPGQTFVRTVVDWSRYEAVGFVESRLRQREND